MALTVSSEQYIFPPRSSDAVPRDATVIYNDLGWVGQLKYNDTHILLKFTINGVVELWNRHGERLRGYTPTEELVHEFELLRVMFGVELGKVTILDGGLLDAKHVAIKDEIVIWDVLVLNDVHLIGTTYGERYAMVVEHAAGDWFYNGYCLGKNITSHVHVPLCYSAEQWDAQWDMLMLLNEPFLRRGGGPLIEGLVFKDMSGRLSVGFREKNNGSWIGKSRVATGRHLF